MFKKIVWISIIIIAAAGFVTLAIGFAKSMQVTGGNTADAGEIPKAEKSPAGTPAAAKNSNTVSLVVMGDSVASGTGDEKGKGIATYLPDYLKNQTTKDLSVENIAVDGLKSAGLLEQLQNDKLNSLIASSDIVLISIGGNDIRSIRSLDDMTKEAQFKGLEEGYLDSLKEILADVRKNSASTCIVFVGLYNPYENAGSSYEDTKLLNTWNYDTQDLVEADGNAIFIPTYDIFKFNLDRFIAPDGLHPNSFGYQAVSNRIAKSIENIINKD